MTSLICWKNYYRSVGIFILLFFSSEFLFSDHILNFYQNLVLYRFQVYVSTQSFTVILFTNLERSGAQNNFIKTPSTSTVWPRDQRENRSWTCTWPLFSMYRHSLKHFTLTNKTVGTTRRALSSTEETRYRALPLWLLVGTPTALRLKLAYRLRGAQPALTDATWYFWYTCNTYYLHHVLNFYGISAHDDCWSLVSIWRFIYKFLNMRHFISFINIIDFNDWKMTYTHHWHTRKNRQCYLTSTFLRTATHPVVQSSHWKRKWRKLHRKYMYVSCR